MDLLIKGKFDGKEYGFIGVTARKYSLDGDEFVYYEEDCKIGVRHSIKREEIDIIFAISGGEEIAIFHNKDNWH